MGNGATDICGHCIRCTKSINGKCDLLYKDDACKCDNTIPIDKDKVEGVQRLTELDLHWLSGTTELGIDDFQSLGLTVGDSTKLCIDCKEQLKELRKPPKRKRTADKEVQPGRVRTNPQPITGAPVGSDRDFDNQADYSDDEENYWSPMSIPVTLLPGIGQKPTVPSITIKITSRPTSLNEIIELIRVKAESSDSWKPFKNGLNGKTFSTGPVIEICVLSDLDELFAPFQRKPNGKLSCSLIVYEARGGKDADSRKKGRGSSINDNENVSNFVMKLRNKYPSNKILLESGTLELEFGHYDQWAFHLAERKVERDLGFSP
ncbi:hypothetical protein BCR33DRAFT_732733 [Rhizoclosmatium globosum]|uniref:Uncharacterized protein n=1 Tax=Rhizoclosmatium globosum TaxID=329046 RepID=A0A1Y2D0S1_9FUNG|nr:hypothetical protein BCR33DRAFT_732733 [Rhizoclosmatium globosum]|eukprot:ORY52893.1 hypothetical protein BCR33DRAFT_732733 [Rhizoclosmatium globosum]